MPQHETILFSVFNTLENIPKEKESRLASRLLVRYLKTRNKQGVRMKSLFAVSLILISCQGFAWTAHDESVKEYNFKFKMSGQTLELTEQAASYEEAYERAAQQCFRHFKGQSRVTESRGLDIIDVCANPRS